MFNIEDHRRYIPIPKRRKDKRKDEKREKQQVALAPRKRVKPNYGETAQIDCSMLYGAPCKCRRMSGVCVQCRREFVVTLGERADVLYAIDRGKILNYKCNVCRGRER